MSNVTQDMSKLFATFSHPNLGDFSDNGNLVNVIPEPLSDTDEFTEPGAGGDRVHKGKKDKSKKISIEVQTGTPIEHYLRRAIRYKNTKFICSWSDERTEGYVQSGNGRECIIKDTPNDRNAETQTFEITSMDYSGD